ncbi:methyltransferase [Streptomyces chryseus]|uniref:O-methyltransferase n=1 Tax=Streptomyces chryseus TaxID=68186 RepID=A0ABQ3DUJ0_9ACTN|nr:methyltransferase [Streptomyces chryseus]GHB13238.1 O-methyltransferase [Streptomyces chryseus]
MADLITPMALRVAATLHLADHVAAGVDTVPALARATGCLGRPLGKVMDHLAALGVMRSDRGRYALNDLATPLLSEWDELGIRPMLDLGDIAGRTEMTITHLLHTVRTGQAAYEGAWGRTLWDDVNETSVPVAGLEAFERNTASFGSELVVEGYEWSAVNSVVDVGGNSGALLQALLAAHPHLHGTLLDLPKFADMAAHNLREAGLGERSTVVGASFFEPLPTGKDVYLLSAILADWSDEQAVDILRNCATAAGPVGRVLLAEIHLAPAVEGDAVERSMAALWIEASMGHPDRTVDDLKALGRTAGLDVVGQARVSEVRSVIEFKAVR